MPFVPFTKKSVGGEPDADDLHRTSAAPAFSKKGSKRRRKTGKVAPAQKALMQPKRAMSGGSR